MQLPLPVLAASGVIVLFRLSRKALLSRLLRDLRRSAPPSSFIPVLDFEIQGKLGDLHPAKPSLKSILTLKPVLVELVPMESNAYELIHGWRRRRSLCVVRPKGNRISVRLAATPGELSNLVTAFGVAAGVGYLAHPNWIFWAGMVSLLAVDLLFCLRPSQRRMQAHLESLVRS